jgi:hypothetical protein
VLGQATSDALPLGVGHHALGLLELPCHDRLLSPTMKTTLSISGKTSFETVSTQPIA